MNEINIKVTGTNAFGPTAAQVRAEMDSLGGSADKVSTKLNKEAHESASLDRELASLAAEAKLLGLSFDDVGGKTEKATNKTTRLRDEMGKFKKDSEQVSKDVGKSFSTMFTGGGQGFGNLVKGFTDAGKLIGKTLSKEAAGAFDGNGIMEKITSAISNPVTGPAIGGLMLAILPGLGSTIGAAIQLAAGGGFLAAGLIVAAHNAGVTTALEGLKHDIGSGLQGATAPFRQELIATTGILSDGFHNVLPGIRDTFAALAPAVQPLARALLGLVQNALPGLEEAAKALGPLFNELGRDLPMLGKAIGDMFHDTASGGNSAAVAMHFLITAVSVLIEMMGIAIKTAEILFDIQLHPQNIGKDIKAFADLNQATQATGHSLSDTASSADTYGTSADAAGKSTSTMGDSIWTAADALKALNDAFSTAVSNTLAMHDMNAQITIDMGKLSKDFGKHGASLREDTLAGAENIKVLDNLVAQLERKREADIAAGKGTQAATDKANAAYNSQILKLEQMLIKLGANKKEVEAFLGAFINKDVTVSVHIKVTQTGPVSVQGVVTGGIPLHGAYAHGGVSGAASGGLRSGMTWVGEDGPELMDLSGTAGAAIYTTGDSKRIAAGGGGFGGATNSAVQVFKFVVADVGVSEFARMISQMLRDYVQIHGGDGTLLGISN